MIQCVCLNPVFQKTLNIENFQINSVNRATGCAIETSAGKGVNVARILKTLGYEPIITGFIGGETGTFIKENLAQEGLAYDFVHTANKTRTCITILDPISKTHTELIEEGLPVLPDEIEKMYQVYKHNLTKCDLVTISGTAPQNVPDDIYYHFVQAARARKLPVLIDTQKALLVKCLEAKPLLVKINRAELGVAFQRSIHAPEMLYDMVQNILNRGIEWVVITYGKEKTLAAHNGQYWDIMPPSIQAVNPIGSGDAMLAGIASAITQGKEMVEAIRIGTACGAANALTLTPGYIRIEDVIRLEQEVIIKRKA